MRVPLRYLVIATLAVIASLASSAHFADGQNPAPSSRAQLLSAEDELIERMRASREGLDRLLAAYEQQLRSQKIELARRKRLHDGGHVSQAYVASAEREVDKTRARMIEVRQWIVEDDLALAEALAREELLRGPPLALGGYAESPSLIRFHGGATWSLADSVKIEKFFLGRFGRALPVSALGQTTAHARMRYDHHDAMDVAVHPNSDEGRALMAYLRQTGVPFIAFRGRMAGVATGAHIHIGRPSLRLASPSS